MEITILPGEFWWGGSIDDGTEMPFSSETMNFTRDFRKVASNQTMPLYISSKGRYVWSEDPFAVTINDGRITLEGGDFELVKAGSTLRDAYLSASKKHFPFSGKTPPTDFFRTAQYNTWMEFTYAPTEEGVLEYAQAIVDNGFTPGILIIDEGWHKPYGDWTFDRAKFPHPKEMIEKLHALGFRVMLWVVPYVTSSGVNFISRIRKDLNPESYNRSFMRNESGQPIIMNWWNGYSAILDFTNPVDVKFLDDQLQTLMRDYGVDGFKFDGGTLQAYSNGPVINGQHKGTADGTYSPMRQNIAWNDFGARYKYHEYKDTFKGGGKPVIQRLRDRGHRWDGDGINTILPNSLAQGLIGHPFICPDMIGGGEWSYNKMPGFHVDEELFIRMAQVSVFFPMMQFSWAPWRVLSKESLEIVRTAAKLHGEFADYIISEVEKSAKTGEPILRNLEYAFPHRGYERIADEFLCGDEILVCPVVTKGTFEKEIVIPEGRWQSPDGVIFGEGRHIVKTPLDRITYFRRV